MKQEKQVPPSAQIPAQAQPQAGQAVPQVQVQDQALPAQKEKHFDRKKWLMLLALVFFLFSIIFIVPVGSLPGFRNLAWWMGFSAQDTRSMSFGRALLTWVTGEGTQLLSSRGRGGNDLSEISVFDRQQGAQFNFGGSGSGLFDVDAVNAERRKRGLGPEGLWGAYEGDDERHGAINRKVNDFSQEARQNEADKNMQEVFFGADADLMARAANDQQIRKGMLDGAKLIKGNVVGSVTPDMLMASLEKASRLSNQEMDKAFGVSTMSAPLSNLNANLASGDAKRDLAQVWLMSKASNRAKQLMLKKQLAAAGYVGMDMPKKVYDSVGENSGVMMSGEELLTDLENVKMQILNEEQCREIGGKANDVMNETVQKSLNLVRTITTTVPRSCDADIAGWSASVGDVRTNCNTVKDSIKMLSENCGMVKLKKEGSCSTENLDTYAQNLTTSCNALAVATEELNVATDAYNVAEAEYQKELKEYQDAVASAGEGVTVDDSDLKAAEQKRDNAEDKKNKAQTNKTNAENKVDGVKDGLKDSDVYDTFNITDANSEEPGGNGDFFPEFGDEADI